MGGCFCSFFFFLLLLLLVVVGAAVPPEASDERVATARPPLVQPHSSFSTEVLVAETGADVEVRPVVVAALEVVVADIFSNNSERTDVRIRFRKNNLSSFFFFFSVLFSHVVKKNLLTCYDVALLKIIILYFGEWRTRKVAAGEAFARCYVFPPLAIYPLRTTAGALHQLPRPL
jgi:hypothetical protein